jgi:hypothetical protein
LVVELFSVDLREGSFEISEDLARILLLVVGIKWLDDEKLRLWVMGGRFLLALLHRINIKVPK